ncbi:MAG: LLM class F420-dependent oxidoreductase [Acidimicrobiia bacterium]
MKYGIMFANTGPYVSPEGAAAIAKAAEQAGFESLWTVEHVVVPREYASAYPYSGDGKMPGGSDFDIPDPLIWLTWVAAQTTTLRLGTGVMILPQRNPVITAKEIATLDLLSGGRVELGVGIGWLEEEFEILGASFPDRAIRTEEYVEAMRALWSQDHATFEGETIKFTEAISRPRPINRKVPVHIGGHSVAAARRAGRLGDGFFPAKGDLPALLDEMRQAAEDAGRDPNTIEVTAGGAGVAAGGEQALDEVGRLAELGVSRVIVPPMGYNPAAIGEVLARFGDEVIAPSQA